MTTPPAVNVRPSPTHDDARAEAERIINSCWKGPPTRGHYDRDALLNAIAQALLAAHRPGEGCVIDDKGVERKVLGTLPLTADGCVIGDWATTFVRHLNEEIHQGTTRTVTYSWTTTTPGRKENLPYAADMCHSTRESASAAQEKPHA